MNVRELIERLQEIENKELTAASPGDGGEYYEVTSVRVWTHTNIIMEDGEYCSKPSPAVVLY